MGSLLFLRWRFAAFAVVLASVALVGGCSKKIGDPCTLSADCGVSDNRQCDTAQLGGYCTQIGCTADGCPSEAACFLFGPRLGGCTYDDREPARTSRSFCMHSCSSDSNCRAGYVCADVTQEPWTAVLLDVEEIKPKACIVPATFAEGGSTDTAEPAICSPVGPTADAGGEPDVGDEPDAAGESDAGEESDAAP
jgi:hypothetical protein